MLRLATHLARTLLAGALIVVALTFTPPALGQGAVTDTPTAGSTDAQANPELWRVFFANSREVNWLAAQYDVWEVDHEDNYVVAAISPLQSVQLVAAGWRLERLPLHMQNSLVIPSGSTHFAGGIPSYPCYRTVEETYADMQRLSLQHPNLASWLDIGNSWEKATSAGVSGYDIHALVLTNRHRSGPKFKLLIMGAVHARELTTAETVARFAEHVIRAYGSDPDITWLLDYGELHLLPIANPDGRKRAEQLLLWRKNTDSANGCFDPDATTDRYGVDLNRNSSFKWNQCESGFCSSGDACDITYRGPAPASEPETVAYQDYLRSIFPDQRGSDDHDAAPSDGSGLILSLHSYGELVLFPWGWTQMHSPNHDALQTLGSKLGSALDYTVCQAGEPGCLYQTDGTVEDWAYGELGVAAYTLELGTEFFQSCSVYEHEILDKAFLALTYAAKVARRPYLTPAGPDIADLTTQNSRVIAGTPVTVTATAGEIHGSGFSSAQHVATARYSVNAPAWISGTQLFTMNALYPPLTSPDEQFSAVIDTERWPPGKHMIFVEAQDDLGHWGPPTATYLDIVIEQASFSVSTPSSTVKARSGETVTHTLIVTNTGILSDSYTANAIANRWDTDVWNDPERPICPGSAVHIQVVVTIPPRVQLNSMDSVVVDIVSRADPRLRSSIRLKTQAEGFTVNLPAILR